MTNTATAARYLTQRIIAARINRGDAVQIEDDGPTRLVDTVALVDSWVHIEFTDGTWANVRPLRMVTVQF